MKIIGERERGGGQTGEKEGKEEKRLEKGREMV
jgi:hypothetical protein